MRNASVFLFDSAAKKRPHALHVALIRPSGTFSQREKGEICEPLCGFFSRILFGFFSCSALGVAGEIFFQLAGALILVDLANSSEFTRKAGQSLFEQLAL